jgi:hypothetical protein
VELNCFWIVCGGFWWVDVLSVLEFLLFLPFGDAAVGELLGFGCEKALYELHPAPVVDSKPGHFGDSPLVCVLLGMHVSL